ncbi:MAG TPA: PilN domain-containing protein [Candidatus Omnitrophota bacterium]|nr:PilN domain-containing protein [Candidatus Omnitrophota bacterium]
MMLSLPRPVHDALRWWSGELAALLPAWARRRKRRILLPPARVLVRQAGFPLAAEENLREVVAFEMDRLLPFQADAVYFDVLVRARDPEQGRLTAEVVAVRRDVVDEVVNTAGGPLAGIGVEGLDPRFELCPPAIRSRALGRAERIMLAVGCLLWLAAAAAPLVQAGLRIDALEADLAEVRADSGDADRLRREIEASLAAERLIVEARNAKPTALAALDEISALVPDDSWLQQVRLGPDGIEVQGSAAAAAQLLGAVEDSGLFAAAAFRAPVTQDAQGGRERFMIGAKWE